MRLERILRVAVSTLVGLAVAQGIAWLVGLGLLTTAIVWVCIAYHSGYDLIAEVLWPDRNR